MWHWRLKTHPKFRTYKKPFQVSQQHHEQSNNSQINRHNKNSTRLLFSFSCSLLFIINKQNEHFHAFWSLLVLDVKWQTKNRNDMFRFRNIDEIWPCSFAVLLLLSFRVSAFCADHWCKFWLADHQHNKNLGCSHPKILSFTKISAGFVHDELQMEHKAPNHHSQHKLHIDVIFSFLCFLDKKKIVSMLPLKNSHLFCHNVIILQTLITNFVSNSSNMVSNSSNMVSNLHSKIMSFCNFNRFFLNLCPHAFVFDLLFLFTTCNLFDLVSLPKLLQLKNQLHCLIWDLSKVFQLHELTVWKRNAINKTLLMKWKKKIDARQ